MHLETFTCPVRQSEMNDLSADLVSLALGKGQVGLSCPECVINVSFFSIHESVLVPV